MKISALYITKNEEANIGVSIDSCKDFVNEIIVVDTGSTDKTKEICINKGAKVFDFEWCDDFSQARNFAISKSCGDYILFLDADEYFKKPLTNYEKEKIEELLLLNNCDAITFPMIDVDKINNKELHSSCCTAIFKGKGEILYKNPIHETIYKTNGDILTVFSVLDNEFLLIHTGYSSNIATKKAERNLNLLERLDEKDTLQLFYCGRECLSLCKYEEAKNYLDLFFQKEDYLNYIHESNLAYLSYCYYYEILRNIKVSPKERLDFIKKMEKEVSYVPEINYLLGVYYFDINLKKSEKFLDNAIFLNEEFANNKKFLNNYKRFEPMIYLYLAKIYEIQGKINKAFNTILVSCLLDNRNPLYFNFLLHLLPRNNLEKNIDIIKKTMRPKSKSDYELIVKSLSYTNLYPEFVYFSSIYNTKYNGDDISIAFAMAIANNEESFYRFIQNAKISESECEDFIFFIDCVKVFGQIFFCEREDILCNFSKTQNMVFQAITRKLYPHSKETDFVEMFSQVVFLLILYGYEELSEETLQYFCQYGEEFDISLICNILFGNKEYGKLSKIIYLCKPYRKEMEQDFIKLILNINFFTDQKDKFIEELYSYYVANGYQNTPCRMMVDLCANLKPNNAKKKNRYLKESRNGKD